MPIIVSCPQCATRLSAPDNAAGKMVKCPKPGCGAIAEVPALLPVEEVPVVEAKLTPPSGRRADHTHDTDDRPRRKPRRTDDDAEDRPRSRRRGRDDDDDWERPRRRRSGANPMAVAGIILGGLVLVAGIGIGVYFLVSHKNGDNSARGNTSGAGSGGTDSGTTDSGPQAPVPAGWVQHTAAKSKFRVYLPKPPSTTRSGSLNGVATDMVLSGGPRERLAANVVGLFIPPETPGVNRDLLSEHLRQGILQKYGALRVVSQRSVTWVGRPATEMTLESSNKAARVEMRQLTTARAVPGMV